MDKQQSKQLSVFQSSVESNLVITFVLGLLQFLTGLCSGSWFGFGFVLVLRHSTENCSHVAAT